MRHTLSLVLCLGAISSMGIAQGPPPADNSINVSRDTMASRDLSRNPLAPRVGSINPEPWPEGATFVEEKSLPIDNNVPQYDPAENETFYPDGRRALAIKMAPGDKLLFKLTSAGSKVYLRTFVPVPPPPMRWRMELLNANKPMRARRASKLEIQNPTSDDQVLFLIVYGEKGNPYRLDMERTSKK